MQYLLCNRRTSYVDVRFQHVQGCALKVPCKEHDYIGAAEKDGSCQLHRRHREFVRLALLHDGCWGGPAAKQPGALR